MPDTLLCISCGDAVDTLDAEGYCIYCSDRPYGRCMGCRYEGWLSVDHYCPECQAEIDGDYDDDDDDLSDPGPRYREYLADGAEPWYAECYPHIPYLGIELEVEYPSGTYRDMVAVARQCRSVHTHVDTSADSSLECGFEVKLGPVVLAIHRTVWPQIVSILREAGCESWDHATTGLHVHIDRRAVVDQAVTRRFAYVMPGRLLRYLYGRRPGFYCSLSASVTREHRAFVSVSGKYHTLEFRGGKGSVNIDRILSIADLVLAVVAYTNRCVRGQTTPDWAEWYEYVATHHTRWPHLARKVEAYESRYGSLRSDFWRIAGDPLVEWSSLDID